LGDGLGGGEHGADTLAVARHVIPEQELGVGRIGDAPPLGGDKLSPVLAVELRKQQVQSVDDEDGQVVSGKRLELGAPVVAIELVDEEVEGDLLGQGPGGVDGNEVHAARGGGIWGWRLRWRRVLLRRGSVVLWR
jgi:hypothetical protein